MTTKNTPGPWYYSKHNNAHDQGLVISETTGANVAVIYDGEADTALIAAAPDLLENLRAVMSSLEEAVHLTDQSKHYNARWKEEIKAAYSAIRKAEGE